MTKYLSNGNVDWKDEATVAQIRALWAEGHSAAQIGLRMGISKNAVVGAAHRLGLEARESPIVRNGTPRPRKPARAPAVTLAPLKILAAAPPPPAIVRPIGARSPSPEPRPARPLAVASSPAPQPHGRVTACCWPIGEPGTRGFRFCETASVPGKPYCADHCEKAFVRLRDRREDAEAVA